MEFTLEQFIECKKIAETFYETLIKIKCPYFNDFVYSNNKGLEHLRFKRWNKTRSQQDQYVRFRHIKLAKNIIENSKTLQAFSTKRQLERIKINSKWQQVIKTVTYYEFIAVMESHGSLVRVKVIVKELEGGEKFFWSIIPFWGTKGNGERILTNGNPEID